MSKTRSSFFTTTFQPIDLIIYIKPSLFKILYGFRRIFAAGAGYVFYRITELKVQPPIIYYIYDFVLPNIVVRRMFYCITQSCTLLSV